MRHHVATYVKREQTLETSLKKVNDRVNKKRCYPLLACLLVDSSAAQCALASNKASAALVLVIGGIRVAIECL